MSLRSQNASRNAYCHALLVTMILLVINNNKTVSKDYSTNTLRYYGIGAQIIKDLNVKNMILISRSKKRNYKTSTI